MTALVLDAGALLATDRGDPEMAARIRVARHSNLDLRTTAVVVAQVWRDRFGRQAELARLLRGVDVQTIDEPLARAAGVLLGLAQTTDVVDATVILVTASGDQVVTSDPEDLEHLASVAGRAITIVRC